MDTHPAADTQSKEKTHPFIAIEGPIGVGKTTLARLLGEALPAKILLEVFEENPFLGDFYADRERYAFQTQLFFLLSRYHQQHSVIGAALAQGALVSDYLFAKDWLFAHLNLRGDELAMYERVHAILGEQIPTPDLVVYLKAPTDALMERIALRDRPYERRMDRDYIHSLRLAYEQFFANYSAASVLALETEGLDIVRDPQARSSVIGRVKSALEARTYQPTLPEMEGYADQPPVLADGRRLPDFQRFHQVLDHEKGFVADLFFNYIGLTEEIGEIGRALKRVWTGQDRLLRASSDPRSADHQEARERAIQAVSDSLEEELADALAYLLKIANDTGIDLEAAYLRKMGRNWRRTWPQEQKEP